MFHIVCYIPVCSVNSVVNTGARARTCVFTLWQWVSRWRQRDTNNAVMEPWLARSRRRRRRTNLVVSKLVTFVYSKRVLLLSQVRERALWHRCYVDWNCDARSDTTDLCAAMNVCSVLCCHVSPSAFVMPRATVLLDKKKNTNIMK